MTCPRPNKECNDYHCGGFINGLCHSGVNNKGDIMETFNLTLTNEEAKRLHFVAELMQQSEERFIKDSVSTSANKILDMIGDSKEYKEWCKENGLQE